MKRSSTCTGRRATAVAAVAVLSSCPLWTSPGAQAATPQDRNLRGSSNEATAVGLPFGQWTWFDVGARGSRSAVYTFFSTTPVLLRVTDALCRGDEFRAYDRGYALFNTSIVGTDPSCDDEPHVERGPSAWLDQSYSKGRFLLQPGHHRVRVQITDSPFGGASAFLRIDKRPIT